jgi:DNA processing protein
VLTADDQALLAALGHGASLEQLSRTLGLTGAQLSTRLLQLELAGRVRAEAGLRWRPA